MPEFPQDKSTFQLLVHTRQFQASARSSSCLKMWQFQARVRVQGAKEETLQLRGCSTSTLRAHVQETL